MQIPNRSSHLLRTTRAALCVVPFIVAGSPLAWAQDPIKVDAEKVAIGTELEVTKSVDAKADLIVAGNVVIGPKPPEAKVDPAGAVAAKSSLDVAGAVRAKSSLDVAGAVTAKSSVDVDGPVNAKATLTVAGNVGIGTTTPGAKLEVAGDARIGGKIQSPQWKITELTDLKMPSEGYRGPGQFVTRASFATQGGTLAIFVSASAWTTVAGPGGLEIKLDGERIGDLRFYFNLVQHHCTMPPRTFLRAGIPAGTHTIEINNNSSAGNPLGVTVDSYDTLQVVVTEYPF